MRLFVAVDLPPEVRDGLRRLLDDLRPIPLPVRWVRPEGIHLTLKFLGEVAAERRQSITAALRALDGLPVAFRLQVGAPGTFPAQGSPRVIWAGLEGDLEPLRRLQVAVEGALRPLGFEMESRPFAPHLTLGRVKGRGRGDWRPILQRCAEARPGAFVVRQLILFRSLLEPSGARYEALDRFDLPAAVREPA